MWIYLTSQVCFVFSCLHQTRISSEEASILRSLHSRVFTVEQDGPSQSVGKGMEAHTHTPHTHTGYYMLHSQH